MTDLREQLQSIYDQHGKLTPGIVVEEARDPDHPLHARVGWSTDEATLAHERRLDKARELIRSVKIQYRNDQGEFKDVRAFHSFRAPEGGRKFEPAEKVAQDPMMTKILLNEMEREWRNLRKRYEGFDEFYQLIRKDLDAA